MNIKKIKLYLLGPQTLLLLGIIILGSYLRLVGVFTNSFAFTYDVGRDMLALSDLVSLNKVSLIGATTGLPGVFYGPWWYVILSPFFIIFSGNPQGIAFTMALFGICSIVLAYFLGRKIGGDFMGISFAALVSISPYMISLSSQIWNPNIAPFFVLLILLILFHVYSGKNDRLIYYLLLGIILGIIIDLEIIFGLLFSTGIVVSTAYFKRKKLLFRPALLFLTGLIFIFSPRILFDLRHNFLMANSFINYFANGAEKSSITGNIIELVNNRSGIFLNEFSYTVALGNNIVGLVLFALFIIVLVRVFKNASKIETEFIFTSLIILVVFFIGVTFFSHDIWPHYLVGLPVIYILLLVITLDLLKKKLKNIVVPCVIVGVIFILNLNPVELIKNMRKPLWEGDAAVYRNQLAAVDYIYQESRGKKFRYVVYTPPIHDYSYQYLFKWYPRYKNRQNPDQRSNIAFFILEPDHENPARLVNWLAEKELFGKITKSYKGLGGIIIQTRILE